MSGLDCRLCLVSDRSLLKGRNLVDMIMQAVRGGATMVQLREKELDSRSFYHLAWQLQELLEPTAVPLIINDRTDIALAVRAAGVHLGQSDLPISAARHMLGPGAIIGQSVENPAQARQAELDGADYIGAGAVFATPTKAVDAPIGLEGLSACCSASSLPCMAIGGITASGIHKIKLAGASGIAISSALFEANDIAATAGRMIRQWNQIS